MCLSCYKENGSPKIINGKTQAAAVLIDAVYDMEGGGAGGHAHIVVDDWNFEDSNIDYCLSLSSQNYVSKTYPDKTFVFVNVVLTFLKTLTLDERYSAQAIRKGII